jgi:hypothetical protein
MCLVYGDFQRPVFLEEITNFISSASVDELRAVREAIQTRTRALRGQRSKGRPRAQEDRQFMTAAKIEAYYRYALGWDWKKVAEEEKLWPTKRRTSLDKIIRTYERRMDRLAAMIYRAVPLIYVQRSDPRSGPVTVSLKPGVLDHKPLQQWLWVQVSLPFRRMPDACKKIVEALYPRGLQAATREDLAKIRR